MSNPDAVAFVEAILDDNPPMLGTFMWLRYQRSEPPDIIILDKAIQATQRAVKLDQDSDPSNRSQLYFDLGVRLKARSDLTHSLEDLSQAMSAFQAAVELTSNDDSYHPERLDRLGVLHLEYFQRVGRIDDINSAVTAFCLAVELTPDSHSYKPARFNNLGTSFLQRFKRTGQLDDIEAAVSSHRRAVELTPDGHPYKPARLCNLGSSFHTRFERSGELGDIEAAVSSHRRAVELTPDGHPDKPAQFGNLGASLQRRYEHTGECDDIEQAVSSHQLAVELMPDGQPNKPMQLNNLGNSLRARFERTGKHDDIEGAVSSLRRAVELTPDGHPDKPARLCNLGSSFREHFVHFGELGDIEAAVSSHRRAVELTPDGHPDKSACFSNLGVSLYTRFMRTGELDDIKQAVSAHRRVIELTPDGNPDKPARFGNLGISFNARFKRTGDLDDIEQAISSHRRAVELIPDGHPNKPMQLNNLGGSLRTRFEHTGEHDDIEQAVSSHRCAVELTPDGHPDKPERLNSLGASLCTRFKRTGKSDDIEQAVSSHRRAVELTPDGHPDKSGRLMNLGDSLQKRHACSGTTIDYIDAVDCYMQATLQTAGMPSIRLGSAILCVLLLSENAFLRTKDRLLSAHSRIIAVLPEIVWLGYDIQRRYDESSRIGAFVNVAVFVAISANALTLAVEWLEAGRSFIWGQVLSLRTPLNELREFDPKLAASLRRVQEGLRSSAGSSFTPEMMTVSDAPGLATNRAADAHRALAIEHDSLLKKIRACPGFEGFLRPKSFEALTTSALKMLNGPVVFINVSNLCHALVLHPNGEVQSIRLPELSMERANRLRELWVTELRHHRDRIRNFSATSHEEPPLDEESPQLAHSDVTFVRYMAPFYEDGKNDATRVLEYLWMWIVHPIAQSLKLMAEDHGHNNVLPHITWCATGPLTQLPLHAAGVYGDPHGPRAFDFLVSSYTPSLSALLRCSEGVGKRDTTPSVLVVTQPATPGYSALPGTTEEGSRLQEVLLGAQIASRVYDRDQATVKSVQQDMSQHPWLHLACHGAQHPTDPTKSAFRLYDGPLTLSDLMETVSENAELAFLSACQTAVGDEKIPEESAHLAAGMLAVGFKGVVATMWSIGDADAPIVVEAYYRELIALRNSGALRSAETGAAYALHAATKVLREKVGETAFMRWAPFVHFGV
ncbi:unnamed protein product [Peniophora sp. CBMAI 1063]|nr:unnamed protein product [Peniophora sp. CBMAI 1063]